jgi:Protein of unknown function (DUF2786)
LSFLRFFHFFFASPPVRHPTAPLFNETPIIDVSLLLPSTTPTRPGQMDIKERIRRLRELSKSSNEHEAAAALDKANDLLVEHNLTLADVEVVDSERIKKTYEAKRRRHTWAREVWGAVARANFCKYWFTRPEEDSEKGDRHTIIGHVLMSK